MSSCGGKRRSSGKKKQVVKEVEVNAEAEKLEEVEVEKPSLGPTQIYFCDISA